MLYDTDGSGESYRLNHVGQAVAHYRRLAAENDGLDVPPPRKIVRFDREGWARLLAVVDPAERACFLRQAGARKILIAG